MCEGLNPMRLLIVVLLLSIVKPAYTEEKVIGFTYVPVIEFKNSWKSDGKEPLKFPPRTGNSVIVQSVIKHSPADEAGLKELDIIRVVNGQLIREIDKVKTIFDTAFSADEMELSIVRSSILNGTNSIKTRINKKTAWDYETITIKPVTREKYIANCMTTSSDTVKEFTITRHIDSPQIVNSYEGFRLYYLEKNGVEPQLYLRITYLGSDWLFIKKYLIKTDKKTYTVIPSEVNRDNGILNGNVRVWEWSDSPIKTHNVEMIKDISTSKAVTVRYEGNEYYKDFELDQEKRDRLALVLASFTLKKN